MKNAVPVSVWMKSAMYWFFVVLLVKLLLSLFVIQINGYCFSEPTANCTFADEDSICYHHEKSYLSQFENLQQFGKDPWKQHSK